jgi:hypothetical protein
MANQSSSVGSRPVADNAKSQAAAVVTFAPAAAGASVTVTPSDAQESVSVTNKSGDTVRVAVNFNTGIVATPAVAAQRVFLVAAGDSHTVDYADHAGDNSAASTLPILSVTITPVTLPTAAGVVEASTLAATTSAQQLGGTVIVNFASS